MVLLSDVCQWTCHVFFFRLVTPPAATTACWMMAEAFCRACGVYAGCPSFA